MIERLLLFVPRRARLRVLVPVCVIDLINACEFVLLLSDFVVARVSARLRAISYM